MNYINNSNNGYDEDNILHFIQTELDKIRQDFKCRFQVRKIINKCKEFFINYSFDNININFTEKDVDHINKKDDIFSIHSADNLAVYLYINSKCKDMLGFNQEFVIGKCLYSLLHKDDLDEISKTHDRVLCGKKMLANYRLITNFKNITGRNKYIKISSYIKKVDNIIITYIKPLKEPSVNSYTDEIKNEESSNDQNQNIGPKRIIYNTDTVSNNLLTLKC